MPSAIRALAVITVLCLAAMASPSVARADDFFPTSGSFPPVVLAARGAQILWSHYEGTRPTGYGTTEDVNRLYVGFGSQARPVAVTNATGFLEGDLATDAHGNEVALYLHCDDGYSGCVRFKVLLRNGAQQQLSSGHCEETEPLMEQGTSIWWQGPSLEGGAHCPGGMYLQYPGRRAQRMHPPRGCRPSDLTGGILACKRTVDIPDGTVYGPGGLPQASYIEHDEIYALKLGQRRWRRIARDNAYRIDPDYRSGESLLSPAVSGGYVYWERYVPNPNDGTARIDIMRAPAAGGPTTQLERTGRLWVHPRDTGGDTNFTFAVTNGALYYSDSTLGSLGIARIDPSGLVFR